MDSTTIASSTAQSTVSISLCASGSVRSKEKPATARSRCQSSAPLDPARPSVPTSCGTKYKRGQAKVASEPSAAGCAGSGMPGGCGLGWLASLGQTDALPGAARVGGAQQAAVYRPIGRYVSDEIAGSGADVGQ